MGTLAKWFGDMGVTNTPDWFTEIGMTLEPMPTQTAALKAYARYIRYADYSAAGSGKTFPAQAHSILMASLGNKVFFSMPPAILEQAHEEMLEVFPGVDKYLQIETITGSAKTKKAQLERWQDRGWPDIIMGSFDAFRALNQCDVHKSVNKALLVDSEGNKISEPDNISHKMILFTREGKRVYRQKKGKVKGVQTYRYVVNNDKRLLLHNAGFNVYFFDEAHRELCNPDNQTHRSLMRMQQEVGKDNLAIYLMTATPAPTELINAYGLIKLTNPDAYFDKAAFERKHCVYHPTSKFKQVVGYKNHAECNEALYKYARRVEKREIMKELKDPLIKTVPVRLTASHKKLYDAIHGQRMAVVGDNVLQIENDQEQRQTLLKIISAPEHFDPDNKTTLAQDNALRSACDEEVEQVCGSGEKMILVSYFQSVVRSLHKHYSKWNPAMVYGAGGVNNAKEVKRFKEDPDCKIIILQWKSGGAGLNLQKNCHNLAFYEMPTSPGDAQQVIGRVDRKGQVNAVNLIFFRVYGTLADKNFRRLLKNSETNNNVIKDRHDLLHEQLA